MRFSVGSYNIHGCRGRDGFDLEAVARVIAEMECDVVALQEVGDVRSGSLAIDQASELARATRMSVLFEPALVEGERRYGNAVLTRFTPLGKQAYDLSVPGRERRVCLRADLRLEGSAQVHVFNLHLGLSRRERSLQAARLLSADVLRDATVSFPTVVMGDFNLWVPGYQPKPLSALVDLAAALRTTGPTYPSRFPILRLDRIYLGPGLLGRSIAVHRSALSQRASDHLPLKAEVELAHAA